MDDIDEQILALLEEDARRTFDDIGRNVNLSAPAVKRRVDKLRRLGTIRGFTTLIDYEARGWGIEALTHLYYVGGATKGQALESLLRHEEVVEAWMVTGEADVIAHVRTRDAASLEELLLEFKKDRLVERTRTEIVLSQLIAPRTIPFSPPGG